MSGSSCGPRSMFLSRTDVYAAGTGIAVVEVMSVFVMSEFAHLFLWWTENFEMCLWSWNPLYHFLVSSLLPCRGARGSQAVSRRNPHRTVCQALIPQLNRNILNIRISTLQSEENQTSTQLHLGLVADAGKEEQEQSKLLVCASNSLKLATWAAF